MYVQTHTEPSASFTLGCAYPKCQLEARLVYGQWLCGAHAEEAQHVYDAQSLGPRPDIFEVGLPSEVRAARRKKWDEMANHDWEGGCKAVSEWLKPKRKEASG